MNTNPGGTTPAGLPIGSTQDSDNPKVIWYATRPERFVIDLAEYAQPRAEREQRLAAALREIKQLVDDAPGLTVAPEHIFDAIWAICTVALEDNHA